MERREMKEYEIPEKEITNMSNLEIINNQITIIIGEINKKVKVNNAYDVVRLSSELRELVRLREMLQLAEKIEYELSARKNQRV